MPVGISYRAMLAAAGSSAAADAYIVNSFSPPVVADFAGVLNSGTEYYRVGGSDSTFDSMFTYTGASLKTMTDSDGNLKWAPHNSWIVATHDLDFNPATSSWLLVGASAPTLVADGGVSDPKGGTLASTININPSGVSTNSSALRYNFTGIAIKDYKFGFYVRQGSTGTPSSHVRLTTNNTSSWNTGTSTKLALTTSWQWISASISSISGTTMSVLLTSWDETGAVDADVTGTVDICFASVVYNSLGGTVGHPEFPGTTYFPSSDLGYRFGARRNHYRYNGSTYDNKGILLESEARTNLIVQSNAFTTTWTDVNATPASAAAIGPDGATSMWNLVDDGTTGTGEVYLDYSLTGLSTSTAYTFSVYVKANALSWCALGTENFTTPANGESFFNLSTGATGTAATGHTQHIEEVASGIYRVGITFTTDGTDTTGNVRIYVADADTDITVDLDGTSSIYVYGAQLEVGATPSSYIPTSGSTVTRAAETLTIDSTNLSYSATAMSFHIKGEMNYADRNVIGETNFFYFGEDLGSTSAYILYNVNTDAGTGEIIFRHDPGVGGWNVESSANAFSPGVNVAYNLASWHTTASMNAAVGGTAIGENTAVSSMPALTSQDLWFGDDRSATGRKRIGTYEIWRMWDADIGDTGIESATS